MSSEQLQAERDRYRAALARIAGAESGIWGRIAHDALRGPKGTAAPLPREAPGVPWAADHVRECEASWRPTTDSGWGYE